VRVGAEPRDAWHRRMLTRLFTWLLFRRQLGAARAYRLARLTTQPDPHLPTPEERAEVAAFARELLALEPEPWTTTKSSAGST
jgi:hypothetical protein